MKAATVYADDRGGTDTAATEDDQRALAEIRRLGRDGDEEAAIRLASALADRARDPRIAGMALVLKLGSLLNLGRTAEWAAELDHAHEVMTRSGDHALLGGFHAVAGAVVGETSLDRSLRHLVLGARELEQVRRPSRDVVDAWHNLAVSYSYAGFHAQAVEMARRTGAAARAAGLPAAEYEQPEVAVRWAVSLDHRGDTAGCVRALCEVVSAWAEPALERRLHYAQRCYYGYAVARLRALGEHCAVEAPPLPTDFPGWEAADLRLLTTACAEIGAGRPDTALCLLAAEEVHPHTLGPGEPVRVRALAHAAAGDHRAALAADREAVRLATDGVGDLRNRLVDATARQLDHEALRRTVQQYASEALTDALTGLPNRRHFDRRITQVAGATHTAVGVIDVDAFKEINTRYGHLTGDLVLQRVAAILARSIRRGDFVARYGGDEFVAILPDTDLDTAHEVGGRIAAAVADGGWDTLVAGTTVSVTIGWAPLTDPGGLVAALEAADRAMFTGKRPHRGIPATS